MKVLWICHFSNAQIREELDLSISSLEILIRKLLSIKTKQFHDFAPWITNGIKEFENFADIELHLISPHYGIPKQVKSFQIKGINYHFFKPYDDSIIKKAIRYISKETQNGSYQNHKIINKLLQRIKPDIVHLFGPENPGYSSCVLEIDTKKYPLIVTMQTLMNDPEFLKNYPISEDSYNYRSKIEYSILQKTKYIASEIEKYRTIVKQAINPNAIFLKSFLALEQKVELNNAAKIFDFTYFSASINKAADIAIEAFAIVCKKYPNTSLNIIGGQPQPFTSQLQTRIQELGLEKNVIFSGKLPTHDDVLQQIQLARFALLPIKIDIISGTIREAMFAKLPVVTTITPGTPSLNEKRESVLLAQTNDYNGIAESMIKLLENSSYADKLSENGYLTVNERWNNQTLMNELRRAYYAVYEHHNFGKDISSEIATY
jgi:glycosyltransferase involved in cell wall biosynthesis